MAGEQQARRARVFLSYSRKDLTIANELIISLESHDFEMVVDREDLFPGEQWEPRLKHFITEADTTICLLSPQWVASAQCVKELDLAIENGRRVIPVIVEQVSPSSLPEAVGKLQFVFFIGEGRSFARGVADLVKALRTDIDWVREQTRLLDRAHEWDGAGRAEALLLRGAALERARKWLEAPRPEQTRVLTLVADFVTASVRGQTDEERKRLRARVRTVALAGMAAIGVLSAGALYLLGEADQFRREAEGFEIVATNESQRAEALETTLDFAVDSQAAAVEELSVESLDLNAAPPSPGSSRQQQTESAPSAPGTLGPVARLNASDPQTRIQAGHEVVEAMRSGRTSEVVGALVSELESPRLEALSASGRFNVLYMLNIHDDWPNSPYAARLSAALLRIEAREAGGVRVGERTQDCVDRLQRKLAGEANVGDRCGGR